MMVESGQLALRETEPKDIDSDGVMTVTSETGKRYVSLLSSYGTCNKKVVSLFSGAGGLDIGLECAGFETLACIEIDRDCRATLAANRPNWKLIDGTATPGDIKGITGNDVLAATGCARGQLGLIVGGPPCQPFSNLGKKQGELDPTNGDLFSHYLRIIRECLPEGLIFENVEGFAQEKHRGVRDYLLNELRELGYSVQFDVLNSADFGDPQVRRRFVLLGIRTGRQVAHPLPTHFENEEKAEQLFRRLGLARGETRGTWRTVGEALAGIPAWRLQREDNRVMGVSEIVRKRMELICQGENFKALPMSMRPSCWASGKHQGHDTFGRLRSDRPSVTIRTSAYNSAKGRYIHPDEHRGLNTAEMAELQSFPHDWQFHCANGRPNLVAIGRQIGNAVPIKLATALGLTMRILLSNHGGRISMNASTASPRVLTAKMVAT